MHGRPLLLLLLLLLLRSANYAPWVIALRAGKPTDLTANGA